MLSTEEKRKKRYNDILCLRKLGLSCKSIGIKYKLTRQRIHSILETGIESKKRCRCKNTFEKYKMLEFCFECFRNFPAGTFHTTHRLSFFSGRDLARELARKRDNYTCQECKKIWRTGERRFDIHHLNGLCGKKSKGYDSPKDISGLITLCHKCHFNRHDRSKKLIAVQHHVCL